MRPPAARISASSSSWVRGGEARRAGDRGGGRRSRGGLGRRSRTGCRRRARRCDSAGSPTRSGRWSGIVALVRTAVRRSHTGAQHLADVDRRHLEARRAGRPGDERDVAVAERRGPCRCRPSATWPPAGPAPCAGSPRRRRCRWCAGRSARRRGGSGPRPGRRRPRPATAPAAAGRRTG